jgi:predicted TIM-barrel fold metal-dependent hydrolase
VATSASFNTQPNGEKMLLPFGAVNPALPDWEEDLRRCQEKYGMPGIRLYPSYHNYTLQKPEVAHLLEQARKRGLLVQLAVRMERPEHGGVAAMVSSLLCCSPVLYLPVPSSQTPAAGNARQSRGPGRGSHWDSG